MAKVALLYAKKEEIPAALVDVYVEQEDGSFKLDADIEDTEGLKSALKKTREEVKDLKKKLKVDITPEELETLREKADAVNDSEEVKKLIKAQKKVENELTAAQARIAKLTTKLSDVM